MNVGIIVEYNPLHNGHIIHLQKVKKMYPEAKIIACMSGNVSMRGEISVIKKFDKTKLALENGIDLIVELPATYTMQSAEIFADYAVKILNSFDVEVIVCGSEEDNTKLYEELYLLEKSPFFQEKIKKNLNLGYSYAKSYRLALNLDLKSNDVLGFNYYKAIIKNNYSICLKTIKREKTDYLDSNFNDQNIASAKAIRKQKIFHNYVPENVERYLDKNMLIDHKNIFPFYQYSLLEKSSLALKNIFLIDEGLENRLKTSLKTYDEYLDHLVSKRYTASKIQRIMLYVLFNITKDEMAKSLSEDIIIRILGYNRNGLEIIKGKKKEMKLYTNIKEGLSYTLDIELKIAKILSLIFKIDYFSDEQKGPVMYQFD